MLDPPAHPRIDVGAIRLGVAEDAHRTNRGLHGSLTRARECDAESLRLRTVDRHTRRVGTRGGHAGHPFHVLHFCGLTARRGLPRAASYRDGDQETDLQEVPGCAPVVSFRSMTKRVRESAATAAASSCPR